MRIRNNVISLNDYRHFDITGNHGLKSLEAESRICDADMTRVLIQQIKQKIRNNSAEAMLAHANTVPEFILSLL